MLWQLIFRIEYGYFQVISLSMLVVNVIQELDYTFASSNAFLAFRPRVVFVETSLSELSLVTKITCAHWRVQDTFFFSPQNEGRKLAALFSNRIVIPSYSALLFSCRELGFFVGISVIQFSMQSKNEKKIVLRLRRVTSTVNIGNSLE